MSFVSKYKFQNPKKGKFFGKRIHQQVAMVSGGGGSSLTEPARKKTKADVLFQKNVPNIPVSNQYSPLTQHIDENMDTDNPLPSSATPIQAVQQPTSGESPRKVRIPPITITGKTRAEIVSWCNTKELKNYRLKLTSSGINLFCNSSEDFKIVRSTLKDAQANYFTHALQDEKELRVILKGLFTMTESELRAALKEVNLDPKTVRILNPRKRKFDDQAHYVLSFPVKEMKMSTLKQTKYIYHCVVEWDFYSPRKFGPTRCHNCNMFGHGKSQCHMKTTCPACSGEHELDKCNIVNDCGELVAGEKFKCPNCSGEHVATDERCPKLLEYLQIQERLIAKNASRNRPKQSAPQNTTHEFPSLPRQNSSPLFTASTNLGRPPRSAPPNSSWTSASAGSSDLMSPTEVLQLTKDLICALRGCKTRDDQINVAFNVASKYLAGYGEP